VVSDRAGIAPAPADLPVSWRKFWGRPLFPWFLLVPVEIFWEEGGGGDEVGEVLACFNLACFDRTFDRGIRADEIGIGFVEERDCGELTVGKSHVMASVDFLPQMGQGSVVLH
jgi:hypothetical protein